MGRIVGLLLGRGRPLLAGRLRPLRAAVGAVRALGLRSPLGLGPPVAGVDDLVEVVLRLVLLLRLLGEGRLLDLVEGLLEELLLALVEEEDLRVLVDLDGRRGHRGPAEEGLGLLALGAGGLPPLGRVAGLGEGVLEHAEVALPGVADPGGVVLDRSLEDVEAREDGVGVLGVRVATAQGHEALGGDDRLLLLAEGAVGGRELELDRGVVGEVALEFDQRGLRARPVALARPGLGELEAGPLVAGPGAEVLDELGLGAAEVPAVRGQPGQVDAEADLLGIEAEDLLVDPRRGGGVAELLERGGVGLQGLHVVGPPPQDLLERVLGVLVAAEVGVERGEVDAELVVVGHHLDEPRDLLQRGVPAPGLLEELLDVERGADEARVGLEGLPIPAERVVDLALLGVGEAHVVAGLDVPGLDREHLGEEVAGSAEVALLQEGEPVLVHRVDPARPGLHGLLVLAAGLLVLAEGGVGVAEVVVEGGVVRVDLEALPEDADGLLGIAHRAVHRAEVVVGEDVLGVELDGPRVGHLGHLEAARLAVGVAEGEEDLGVVLVRLEGPLERGYRVLRLAEAQVGGARVQQGLDVAGRAREHAREGLQGLLRAVGAQVDRAEDEAGLVGLGPVHEVGAGVALGHLEVAELQRRPGALEVGNLGLGLFRRHRAVLEGRAEISAEKSPARDAAPPRAEPAAAS